MADRPADEHHDRQPVLGDPERNNVTDATVPLVGESGSVVGAAHDAGKRERAEDRGERGGEPRGGTGNTEDMGRILGGDPGYAGISAGDVESGPTGETTTAGGLTPMSHRGEDESGKS